MNKLNLLTKDLEGKIRTYYDDVCRIIFLNLHIFKNIFSNLGA